MCCGGQKAAETGTGTGTGTGTKTEHNEHVFDGKCETRTAQYETIEARKTSLQETRDSYMRTSTLCMFIV